MPRPRTLVLLTICLALAASAAITWRFITGGTVDIVITRAMIDDALARKFPKEKTYLKVVRVTYAHPQVILEPGSDRARVSLDTAVDLGIPDLLGKSYRGSAAITTRVAYRPESKRFHLIDPTIESLDIPKLSARDLEVVRGGLNLAAKEWADEFPVYELKPKDLTRSVVRRTLKGIRIERDRIIATFGW